MKRLGWLLLAAAIAAAAWLLLADQGGGGSGGEDGAAAPAPARPAAGVLDAKAAEQLARSEAAAPESVALPASPAAAEAPPATPVAWFHGQLRVVSGELPAPPRLTARCFAVWTETALASVEVPVARESLEFRVGTTRADLLCEVRFHDVIRPVRVHGGTLEPDRAARFAALDQTMVVEVEVRPHAAVLFLHAADDSPLGGASAWHRVATSGSSSTYGSTLGEDGLMIFDFERLADVGNAATVGFAVLRPPDVGYSQSPDFPIAEFLEMPRPVVLRFGATERLRFRVLDPENRPLAGALVTIGGGDGVTAGADGRVEVLQSAPPATDVRAEAPGFLSEEFAIAAAAHAEQDLVLWPASRLILTAEEKPPDSWSSLQAEVSFDGEADASALTSERFQPGRFAEGSGGSGMSWNPSKLQYKLSTGFSDQGRVIVDGILADVPASVRVILRGATILEMRVPFVPGDGDHEVHVGPLPELGPLQGRVMDAAGQPIPGASLGLLTEGSYWNESGTTDAQGAFDLGMAVVGSSVELRAAAAGFAPTRIRHSVASGDLDSIGTLTLLPGLSLVLTVLGPDDAPFAPVPAPGTPPWAPYLDVLGRQIEATIPPPLPLGPGEFWFADLPEGEFACRLRHGYVELHGDQTVVTTSPRATVTLTEAQAAVLRAGS